jgi:hypothetical protein
VAQRLLQIFLGTKTPSVAQLGRYSRRRRSRPAPYWRCSIHPAGRA